MAKKIIISFLAGIGISFIIIWTIFQGQNNKLTEQLSNTIAAGERITTELQQNNLRLIQSNTRLSDTNKQLQTGIGNLEKQIRIRDTEYQRQLEEIRNRFGNIKDTLGKISEGFTGTEGTIQGIVDGIEQIKNFIKAIEFN